MATTVSIKIVNMQQVSGSAFPKGNELSSARLANFGKRLSSGLELEECIVGESGRADSCKGLYPVGIRGGGNEGAAMVFGKRGLELLHGTDWAAVLLEACEVRRPDCDTFAVLLERGYIFAFNYRDTFADAG